MKYFSILSCGGVSDSYKLECLTKCIKNGRPLWSCVLMIFLLAVWHMAAVACKNRGAFSFVA